MGRLRTVSSPRSDVRSLAVFAARDDKRISSRVTKQATPASLTSKYIALAPVIDAAGHMLDGSALTDVIRVIDGTVVPSPCALSGGLCSSRSFSTSFPSDSKHARGGTPFRWIEGNRVGFAPGRTQQIASFGGGAAIGFCGRDDCIASRLWFQNARRMLRNPRAPYPRHS